MSSDASRVGLRISLSRERDADTIMIGGGCGLRGFQKQSRRGRNPVSGAQFQFGAGVKTNQAQSGGAKPARFHFRRNWRVERDDWRRIGY